MPKPKRKAKQELYDILVTEVSLVDYPANEEEEFAVMKSLTPEELEMAEQKAAEVAKADEKAAADGKPENGAEVESVNVAVADETDDAVKKAMDQVTAMVEGIVNQANPKPDTKPVAKSDPTPRDEYKTQLEKAGLGEEMVTKALEAYDAVHKADDAPKAEPEQPKPESKSEPVAKAEPEIPTQKSADDVLAKLGEAIAKAQTFSPANVEALTKAVETLQGILAPPKPESKPEPVAKAVDPSADFQAIAKSMTEGMAAIAKAVETKMNAVAERLDKIEKTRMPSQSVDGNGDNAPVKKSNMWSNVL